MLTTWSKHSEHRVPTCWTCADQCSERCIATAVLSFFAFFARLNHSASWSTDIRPVGRTVGQPAGQPDPATHPSDSRPTGRPTGRPVGRGVKGDKIGGNPLGASTLYTGTILATPIHNPHNNNNTKKTNNRWEHVVTFLNNKLRKWIQSISNLIRKSLVLLFKICPDKNRKRSGHVQKMFRKCLEMFSTCSKYIQNLFRKCSEHVQIF